MSDQHFSATGDPTRAQAPSDPPSGGGTPGSSAPGVGTDGASGAAGAEFREAADGELAALKRERDEYYDLLLRKTAEFDNYRRRQERERRELGEYAAADVIGDILPFLDDLERAIGSAPAGDPMRAGVELIHRHLLDLLKKRGVTPIEALGADFDPHVHQAVTQEVSDQHRDNEVMEELRRGYKIGDRLLRPAMVKVATRG